MLLDFAAIAGDSLSYYMDHQFGELDPSLSTERDNIIRHLRRAGIKAVPPSPSSVDVTFFIDKVKYNCQLVSNSFYINGRCRLF